MQRLTANKMPNFSKICQCQQVIAGLVRSSKNISVHYRQPDRHVTVKVYMFVQISNILKVCVQNVLHVLECKLEDVDITA